MRRSSRPTRYWPPRAWFCSQFRTTHCPVWSPGSPPPVPRWKDGCSRTPAAGMATGCWRRAPARALYHAALASGANHLITLVVQAADLLRAAGVPDPARMLTPLLSAALDNALRLGDAGLTGPVARGDADTVADHIEVLRDASPEALRAYVALARLTADRALAARMLAAPDAQRLLDVLAGAPR